MAWDIQGPFTFGPRASGLTPSSLSPTQACYPLPLDFKRHIILQGWRMSVGEQPSAHSVWLRVLSLSAFLSTSAVLTSLGLRGGKEEPDSVNRIIWNAVPLRLKCLFPSSKKSKSYYRELSFEKSIHPLKFTDPSSQVVPPLAVSQVTALYNPSLNNIHHDK